MKAALLADRGVVKVEGADARTFLNGLASNDINAVAPGRPRFAALLTPQGKIVADFIVAERPEGGFLLDCPRALAPMLVEKLNFYKLRAKVAVADLSETLAVVAVWGGEPAGAEAALAYPDPRLAALGWRLIVPEAQAADIAGTIGAALADAADYDAHRIALGVPRGGQDFAYSDAFPHEADMDQLGGVDFHKGCYVGQEVVSRVEHRGTARSRVVPVAYDDHAPMAGLPVLAGDKQIGTFGSAANGHGLALLRLDRTGDALAAGTPITAGGIALRPVKPAWATFAWLDGATTAADRSGEKK